MGKGGSEKSETSGQRLVYFAAERTFLAWVRMAVSLITLGFVVDRFGLVLRQMLAGSTQSAPSRAFSFWTGTVLIILGVLVNIVAAIRYFRFENQYQRYGNTDPGKGITLAVIITILVAIVGCVIATYLITVTE